MMVVNNVPHISPSFFYSTIVCDEAFRPTGRFKRLPKNADEISMQALQYAIVAYASQYGSQNPGEWRDTDSERLRRQKDTDIAEAAWIRARDFLMTHSSVTTFRMAYAIHLFANACPPLRTARANMDVVQDAVFTLQTGLRMMDDLATDLLRQQDEELFALGYHNTDGAKMDDNIYLRSEPSYRARVERANALKDVAENLLWYSGICDAATTSGFGMPPSVRSSTRDKVDIDAMQLTAALPAASISAPRNGALDGIHFVGHSSSMQSVPGVDVSFGANGFGSLNNVSPNSDHMVSSDPAMLRLAPDLMMPAAAMSHDFGGMHRTWPSRAESQAHAAQIVPSSGGPNQSLASAMVGTMGSASDESRSWIRVAERALQASKQLPYIVSRFAAAPGDPTRVKEYLEMCQTGAATQIMIWQRNGNFRACLDNPSCSAAELTERFQRTWSMILFVQQVFQPLLDINPNLYPQMPASAQSMTSHVINQVNMGTLLFLELCSFLEGTPWLQGSRDPSWPRASSMLRTQLDQSRDLRHEIRRRSALRIGKVISMVDQQVERTLRYGGSPPRDNSDSGHSSPKGSSHSGHRGSDAGSADTFEAYDPNYVEIRLPQGDMIVPALQIHSSRHPVPTHLASALHISFCALVPDALQEISQHGSASPITLDALDANLRGLQGILDSVLTFGTFFHREPGLDTLFSTRNWLSPDRPPMVLTLR